jgi:hypothetical protein
MQQTTTGPLPCCSTWRRSPAISIRAINQPPVSHTLELSTHSCESFVEHLQVELHVHRAIGA